MARYRVGDSYLSEQEFESHLDHVWSERLFIIGAIAAFLVSYQLFKLEHLLELGKEQRFFVIMFFTLTGGYALSKMQLIIRTSITLLLVVGFVSILGSLLWYLV